MVTRRRALRPRSAAESVQIAPWVRLPRRAFALAMPARQMERVREGYDEKEKIARGELSHRGQFSCAGLAARRCNFPLTTLPCPVIESSPRANNIVPQRALAYTSPVSDQQRTDSKPAEERVGPNRDQSATGGYTKPVPNQYRMSSKPTVN